MTRQTIAFSPELDERQLDREVGTIDDQLEDVATDVPVSWDADELEQDAFAPAGGSGGGGMGGGGGVGKAAGVGAVASKIPSSVAGITASAAMPVALSGAIGVGMVSAMGNASARLQTSSSLLGVAVDNFFRAPGDVLDKFVARPISKSILDLSTDFDDQFRDLMDADGFADRLAEAIDTTALFLDLAPGLGGFSDALQGAGDVARDIGNLSVPSASDLLNKFKWPSSSTLLEALRWPSADNLLAAFVWPTASEMLGKFPSLSVGDLKDEILGGGDGGDDDPERFTDNLPERVDENNGGDEFEPPDFVEDNTTLTRGTDDGDDAGGFPDRSRFGSGVDDDETDSSGSGYTGGFPDRSRFSLNGGGRVTSSGVANVHRGELVADPDRLVSELASAIDGSGGGGGADMSNVERKLDELNRNISRLASEMQSMELRTDSETIGRVASQGKRQRVGDTDPTV